MEKEEKLDLNVFLIDRCSKSMKLASDFYWYLNCEKEDDYMLKEYQR